ncbi:PTS sugar transporter subunit IIA [Agromyces mediolanus]|uniref:BglG family transcription antiterminator n=1 Tax=Agromyces mediolanus TaxID=41986 RepID=UPI0038339941
MAERWQRLLDELARADGWTTASELADRLGVTTRTVRSWVVRANEAGRLVRSSPAGYRVDLAALAASDRTAAEEELAAVRPEGRMARVIRALADAEDGVDAYWLAGELHVSDSTLDADLARARARLGDGPLAIVRSGAALRLTGPESAKRRLLGSLLREESARGRIAVDALRQRFPELPGFRERLVAGLLDAGYAPNEYALDDVLLHLAIAADRVSRHRPIEDAAASGGLPGAARGTVGAVAGAETRADGDGAISALLAALVAEELDVVLPPAELAHLSKLLRTRAATTRLDPSGTEPAGTDPAPAGTGSPRAALVRGILRRAGAEYLVDLDDEDVVERLALHVDNLAERSAERSFSRNPLTPRIKAAYPLIYELGVYVASELGRAEGITVNDDEIAYLAMHLGAHLDRRRGEADLVRVLVSAPRYHGVADALVDRVREVLGAGAAVAPAPAPAGPAPSGPTAPGVPETADPGDAVRGGRALLQRADLVVAVVPPEQTTSRLVLVSPIPTDDELERVRSEVVRLRRARRTARLAARLSETIEPGFFVRGLRGLDREGIIRLLGERLVAAQVIDRGYVDGAVERERMSSTAFAEHLAVPHAMAMTARRTAIAIGIDEVPIDWAGTPVHVVALIAFADSGRAEFQEVFDHFVETFSERDNVLRLVRGATDYPGFLAELARLMDADAEE